MEQPTPSRLQTSKDTEYIGSPHLLVSYKKGNFGTTVEDHNLRMKSFKWHKFNLRRVPTLSFYKKVLSLFCGPQKIPALTCLREIAALTQSNTCQDPASDSIPNSISQQWSPEMPCCFQKLPSSIQCTRPEFLKAYSQAGWHIEMSQKTLCKEFH